MSVNSNFNQQSPATPAEGAYAQPSPGIAYPVVTPADPTGLAYATYVPAGTGTGLGNLQTVGVRDSAATVQGAATVTSAGAGGTVVTITPGAAGLWEVSGLLSITGTTVGTADSNNFRLMNGAGTAMTSITFPVTGTTGTTVQGILPATVLNVASGATAVQVQAAAAATSGAVYAATLIARRVG